MASDPTFRSYKADQAQKYAAFRPSYTPMLYEHIFAEHAARGGGFGVVVDVGCGPGNATRDLALTFDRAVGVDPGQEMINTAKGLGGKTKQDEDIKFEVCEAESLASVPGLPLGEVDMITAATSAHWFDMEKFWEQAAKLLRPGGTVAIWIRGPGFCHPDTPHANEINVLVDEFQEVIAPFMQPGNVVAHNLYDDLKLPWQTNPTQTAFPEAKFQRFEWDRGGVLSDGKDFFGGSMEIPPALYRKLLETASPVTRWRMANAELVGTDKDSVEIICTKIQDIVGDKLIRGGSGTALLMLTKAE